LHFLPALTAIRFARRVGYDREQGDRITAISGAEFANVRWRLFDGYSTTFLGKLQVVEISGAP
jgi:hypothetical protein